MDTYVDERDYKLLEADKYTFFVLVCQVVLLNKYAKHDTIYA